MSPDEWLTFCPLEHINSVVFDASRPDTTVWYCWRFWKDRGGVPDASQLFEHGNVDDELPMPPQESGWPRVEALQALRREILPGWTKNHRMRSSSEVVIAYERLLTKRVLSDVDLHAISTRLCCHGAGLRSDDTGFTVAAFLGTIVRRHGPEIKTLMGVSVEVLLFRSSNWHPQCFDTCPYGTLFVGRGKHDSIRKHDQGASPNSRVHSGDDFHVFEWATGGMWS